MGLAPLMAAPARASPLTRKLAERVALSPDETAILNELQLSTRTFLRNGSLMVNGRSFKRLFVIMEGVAIRSRILSSGKRQILNILLPGDIGGIFGISFTNALYSIKSLTDVTTVAYITTPQIRSLLITHPQLTAKLFWYISHESYILSERIVDIGSRSSVERVAHLLLEMLVRLQAVGLADEGGFYRVPLTQGLIADAVGLSFRTVNRILQQLREDNLVFVDGQRVTVKDMKGLSKLADFEPGYLCASSLFAPAMLAGAANAAQSGTVLVA